MPNLQGGAGQVGWTCAGTQGMLRAQPKAKKQAHVAKPCKVNDSHQLRSQELALQAANAVDEGASAGARHAAVARGVALRGGRWVVNASPAQ